MITAQSSDVINMSESGNSSINSSKGLDLIPNENSVQISKIIQEFEDSYKCSESISNESNSFLQKLNKSTFIDEVPFRKRKQILTKCIKELEKKGLIKDHKLFNKPDDAALNILRTIAPLSRKFGIELAGHIIPSRTRSGRRILYKYQIPYAGEQDKVSVSSVFIAYHTHRSGSLFFSNLFNRANEIAIDTEWVRLSGKTLYLGVQLSGGVVGVSACEPMSKECSTSNRGGAPGRKIG